MAPKFDITPQQRASQLAFIQRQLFREPPAWTQKDVDLSGKTAIVTGSNTGLGFECSRQLLDLGLEKLILAVRSEANGEEAKRSLLSDLKPGRTAVIEVWKLDLSSYDSIMAFAERAKTLERLDIAIHNAGLIKSGFQKNKFTGHEETVQVNYLATALFTLLLLPVLKEKSVSGQPGRLVIVSSDTAAWAAFKERNSEPLLASFDKPESFDSQDRYATSKLLGQMFLTELVKRVPSSVAIINAPNPGLCKSSLAREMNSPFQKVFMAVFYFLLGRTLSVGARAFTDAAVKQGAESHGQYLEDGKVQPMPPLLYEPEGEKIAERLWRETLDELAFANVAKIVDSLSR
ncbi:short chain dehydrogenase domain-containing protein [Trichoderma breve]|uniref:Short chain dehydrogenase domain-containing protein n=1 Tax=Trichoderma breve TaxID=2034170 RepID=A0A9W9BCG4_9HYPO|nr:short chain dehydrogenase domain-containing protein [Trichoderma breve]KAJ4859919.1 short chain dehydrogenase domain-containing protein [Trichoderma breve]